MTESTPEPRPRRPWRAALANLVAAPLGHVCAGRPPRGAGDNRDQSHDSRYWGPVRREKILGRARVIYWSWSPEGHVRWDRVGRRVE